MLIEQTLSYIIFNIFFARVGADDVKVVYTNGYYYSQYFPLEENLTPEGTLRFAVRAPRDAHILLAPSHDVDAPVYEIVLGAHNNTLNHIRGRCPCQEEPNASIRVVNLLSVKEFRTFWTRVTSDRFKSRYVQIGFGDADTPFHEWRDPRPLVPQYLSFRSATRAEWRYGFRDSNYDRGVSSDKRRSIVTSTGFGQYFPLSDVVSHSDDGITLYFTARTGYELQVLLSPIVGILGDVYLIGIREDGAYIKKRLLGENKVALALQQRFLNSQERTRFWIKITNDGVILFGKDVSKSPLLQWRDANPLSPQYLSFSLHQRANDDSDSSEYADVQYGLGADYTLSSQDCTPRWKESSNTLVTGAVRGGRQKGDVFICRGRYQGDFVPGNYVVDEDKSGRCYISNNFSVLRVSEFEVLTGCNMKWVSASLGYVPEGSIVGGYEEGKHACYVARVKHEGMLIIGKLKPAERIAYVPYDEQELPFTNYETLVPIGKQEVKGNGGTTRMVSPYLDRSSL